MKKRARRGWRKIYISCGWGCIVLHQRNNKPNSSNFLKIFSMCWTIELAILKAPCHWFIHVYIYMYVHTLKEVGKDPGELDLVTYIVNIGNCCGKPRWVVCSWGLPSKDAWRARHAHFLYRKFHFWTYTK